MSVTTSFTLSVTNVAPKVVTVPGDSSLVHGKSLTLPLISNFADDDGDLISMTCTYTKSGGAAVKIPNGIFSVPSPFTIDVKSTSFADTGVYVITMIVSDGFPKSVTTSFTLSITNAAPKVVTVPGDVSLVHGKSVTIPLASNFIDDDGDAITMTCTYTKSGGAAVKIPNGIFSVPSAFTIDVKSTSIADTGVYLITMIVSDGFPMSVTTSFSLSVTNAAPKVVSVPGDVSLVHKSSLTFPLASKFIDDDGDAITMKATY
jgi:large repetitive protein